MNVCFLFFHFQFTFGKVWLLYAQFEIRQKDLKAARQALVSVMGDFIIWMNGGRAQSCSKVGEEGTVCRSDCVYSRSVPGHCGVFFCKTVTFTVPL